MAEEVKLPVAPEVPVVHPAPTVSVQDFTELTEKVYSLASKSDLAALAAKLEAPVPVDSVLTAAVMALAGRITALETAKTEVPAPPPTNTSALEAQVTDITDRLDRFNARSAQHI